MKITLLSLVYTFFDDQVINFSKKIKYSKRGELEITDLLKLYLKQKKIDYKILGRGYLWYDMGTIESINEASNIIENIQNRQGTALGNIHEVSYLKKFISKKKLKSLVTKYKSPYFDYIKNKYF